MNDNYQDLVMIPSMVILYDLPIPPSSNAIYKIINVKGKQRYAPSKELKDYKTALKAWEYMNKEAIREVYHYLTENEEPGTLPVIFIQAYFCFHKSRLYAKSGEAKKLDTSNRIKALHDGLAEIFQVDDKIFWSVYAEKLEIQEDKKECVTVMIEKTHCRKAENLFHEIQMKLKGKDIASLQ